MNKLNSIYVSILALVVAIAALVMCIMCCNNKQSVRVEQALLDNPEMIVNAMQKYEENMREQALAGAQKLIDANIEDVNNDANTPFVGAADAEKVVVEFYDYSCGYCHRLFPELKAVMANNGDVKFAFKPLTFVSPISEYAARAALAANKQGKFIEMHNAMFEFGGQLTEAAIDEIAGKQGLDMEKYKADLNSQAVSDELAAVSELANKIQINGVPALVVNGKMVQTLDGSVIQDALNK